MREIRRGEEMPEDWRTHLKFDPITQLLASNHEAILFFTKKDLLEEDVQPIDFIWQLPNVSKLLQKQQEDGSWKYRGGKPDIRSHQNYNQIETYRILGELVEKYGMNRSEIAIKNAVEFLFQFQTDVGDFRGIYGNQYTPNYTGAIMELIIKAGYENDTRIEKGFKWLLSFRHTDGGWTIPIQTVGGKLDRAALRADPILPDLAKPSGHMETGCVLRAFAAHPKYRLSPEAKIAGEFLASRFFKQDTYSGRQDVRFWEKITYPFWFTDILSALDSLSFLGFTSENPNIQKGLSWFFNKQE